MPLYLDHLERLTLLWVPLKANSFLFYLINVSELYTQLWYVLLFKFTEANQIFVSLVSGRQGVANSLWPWEEFSNKTLDPQELDWRGKSPVFP